MMQRMPQLRVFAPERVRALLVEQGLLDLRRDLVLGLAVRFPDLFQRLAQHFVLDRQFLVSGRQLVDFLAQLLRRDLRLLQFGFQFGDFLLQSLFLLLALLGLRGDDLLRALQLLLVGGLEEF